MTDSPSILLLGLLTGFLFGFVLQKGGVTKYPVIVGQFLLRDFTVLKVMLTAIIVGGIGVYSFKAAGMAALHVKPAQMAAVVTGGLVFGVGMVLLGYCPGTGVAAAAEGKRDALFGVLGMLLGAAVFAEVFGVFTKTMATWFNLGPVTLPEITGLPAWALWVVLAAISLAVFWAIDRSRTLSAGTAKSEG